MAKGCAKFSRMLARKRRAEPPKLALSLACHLVSSRGLPRLQRFMKGEVMKLDDRLIGTWVSSQPFDSEDYLVEYHISRAAQRYRVGARDYRDGEEMKISKVRFDGQTLDFISLMPSTGRKGQNRFRLRDNSIEAEFTFTVRETLKRIASREDLDGRLIGSAAQRAKRRPRVKRLLKSVPSQGILADARKKAKG